VPPRLVSVCESTCHVFKRISGTERFERFAHCRFLFGGHDHQDLLLRPRCSAPVVRDCIRLDAVHEDRVLREIHNETWPSEVLSAL